MEQKMRQTKIYQRYNYMIPRHTINKTTLFYNTAIIRAATLSWN